MFTCFGVTDDDDDDDEQYDDSRVKRPILVSVDLAKLVCQSSTVMLSLGINYSMRDHIYDVNYCA